MIDKEAEQHVQTAERLVRKLLDTDEKTKRSPKHDRECKELCVGIGFSLFRALLCQLGAEKRYRIEAEPRTPSAPLAKAGT